MKLLICTFMVFSGFFAQQSFAASHEYVRLEQLKLDADKTANNPDNKIKDLQSVCSTKSQSACLVNSERTQQQVILPLLNSDVYHKIQTFQRSSN